MTHPRTAGHYIHTGHFSMKIPGQLSAKINILMTDPAFVDPFAVNDWPEQPATARLENVALVDPLQQGELDNLCGVYSIINALRLVHAHRLPLTDKHCELLFQRAIRFLDTDDRLLSSLHSGMSIAVWHRLANSVCAHAKKVTGTAIMLRRPFRPRQEVSLDLALCVIHDAVLVQRPVMVLLRGAYRHFTIITGYTATRYLLHDSYGFRWINKKSLGIDRSIARHQLVAASITLVDLG